VLTRGGPQATTWLFPPHNPFFVALHNTVGWAWRYRVGSSRRLMYLVNVRHLQLPPEVPVKRYWLEYFGRATVEYDPGLYERMEGARALFVIYDLSASRGRAVYLDLDTPTQLFTLFIRTKGRGVLPEGDLEAAFERFYVPARAFVAFAGGDIGLAAYAPDPEDCACLRKFALKRGGDGWEVLPYGGGGPQQLAGHLERPELEEGAEELCLELATDAVETHLGFIRRASAWRALDELFTCPKWRKLLYSVAEGFK